MKWREIFRQLFEFASFATLAAQQIFANVFNLGHKRLVHELVPVS